MTELYELRSTANSFYRCIIQTLQVEDPYAWDMVNQFCEDWTFDGIRARPHVVLTNRLTGAISVNLMVAGDLPHWEPHPIDFWHAAFDAITINRIMRHYGQPVVSVHARIVYDDELYFVIGQIPTEFPGLIEVRDRLRARLGEDLPIDTQACATEYCNLHDLIELPE
jgi:hypothetical protein